MLLSQLHIVCYVMYSHLIMYVFNAIIQQVFVDVTIFLEQGLMTKTLSNKHYE